METEPKRAKAARDTATDRGPAAGQAPPYPRRVVVLANKGWTGLFLTTQLARGGVDVIAMVVETEPADGVFLSARGWWRCRKDLGIKLSTLAFLGLPQGPGYVLRRARDPEGYPSLDDVRGLGIPVHRVDAFKSEECHELVRRLDPDVTVICGTPILPGSLLAIARTCSINIHTSLLPHYRGGDCFLWPVFFRDTEKVGYTIHEAVAAVDAGAYLFQKQIPVTPDDTDGTVMRRCFLDAAPRLARILREDPLDERSWKQYEPKIPHAFRYGSPEVRHHVFGRPPLVRLKGAVKRLCVATGIRPVGRRTKAGRAAVFYFHRTLADSTPAGDWRRVLGHPTVSELREKLAYLRRHFELIGVRECLGRLSSGEPLGRDVAVVTVDDGYRDFRTNLLPLLEELSVPVGFFVCSGAVESGTVWFQRVYDLIDRVRGDRVHVPWMGGDFYFGDVQHRVLTVEHVLMPFLKRLRPDRRLRQVAALLRANEVGPGPSGDDAFCDVDDLLHLRGSPWVELLLHSHAHHPFETLTDDDLREDIRACRAFFRDRLGVETGILSYPNGHFKEHQQPLLRELGVTHAFSTSPGVEFPAAGNPLALRRNGIGGGSIVNFAWDVAGLLRA